MEHGGIVKPHDKQFWFDNDDEERARMCWGCQGKFHFSEVIDEQFCPECGWDMKNDCEPDEDE